jgi:histidine triad (HIT) family protein
MEDCLFCRVIDRKLPAKIVHEDERAVVIEDIHPQAPVHLLVLPRKHLPSLKEALAEDEALLGHLFLVAAKGYRTVINNGTWAGQSVFHLHVHVLGGRTFHWPPG